MLEDATVNDIPYLEPLLFWLRNDETLKKYFTDNSFFMPKHTLVEATEEAMRKDCPAPRALWILPGNTRANQTQNGCRGTGIHSFHVVVYVQCLRDTFQIYNKYGKAALGGQYVELSEIRQHVKHSVAEFSKGLLKQHGLRYSNLRWVGDTNLYPDENNFLTTAIEYEINIL